MTDLQHNVREYAALGIDLSHDHVPVPTEHTPELDVMPTDGTRGVFLMESDRDADAWVHCERPLEVGE
jgi:hypothetical protein